MDTTNALASGISDKPGTREYFTIWYVYAPDRTDKQIASELYALGMPIRPEQCRHTYDCCGQKYSAGLVITRTIGRTLAYMRVNRNV